jgi:hypothetical protein
MYDVVVFSDNIADRIRSSKRLKRNRFFATLLLALAFSVLGFTVMGYHPGAEDDGVYLSAIKADLNPALFPHDSDFFRLQLQATVFDGWMAHFVHATGISVAWAELIWQFVSLFVILWACQSIAAQLFEEPAAQWSAVALVSAMFTLPVAGTALYLVDQHLHPRAVATALVLIAISRILAGKRWHALPLLILSVVLHPIMGILGVSFCFFLTVSLLDPVPVQVRAITKIAASFMPLGWIFESPSPDWRQALNTRTYYFLSRWAWYEWLGALAPLLLFWLLWRFAQKRGETKLARLALAIFLYSLFQFLVAVIALDVPALVRLTPMQPMRFLHLVYVFLCLIAGGLIGKYLLRTRLWRWAAFLLIANGAMFLSQRALFAGTPHLELPSRASSNPWLQAFAWIRQNTPRDAYFTLDPNYMAEPGEDYHSFRALAERSELSDAVKDAAVATQVPSLATVWREQQAAQAGWKGYGLADFERLKAEFGVNWTLVAYPAASGLDCKWHNDTLSVCKIP